MASGGSNDVSQKATNRLPFYVVGKIPDKSHDSSFRPAESNSANTQGLPNWQIRLVHPDMYATTLLSDQWTEKDSHHFYRKKYIEGSQVMSLFNNRQAFACKIEKVFHYTPEQIQADADARAEADKITLMSLLRRMYRMIFGTNINDPKPLEPLHFDIRFFSPFRTWTDDDPRLLRKNVPQSRVIGGRPAHDFTVTETLRNIERFVETSWPHPGVDARILVNNSKYWKQPKGERKVFATEVFTEPGVNIEIDIDGLRLPCLVLLLDDLESSFLSQFFERGKLWWL